MSTVVGLQVPVIPLVELFGRLGTVPPAQMVRLVPKPKVGVILGVTVTSKVVGNAHRPAVGVKV